MVRKQDKVTGLIGIRTDSEFVNLILKYSDKRGSYNLNSTKSPVYFGCQKTYELSTVNM